MLTRSELNKVSLAQCAFRHRNLIDEAEAIYKEKPEWMVRRLRKLDKRIKRKALSGSDTLMTLGWFSFGFLMKNRLAMAIAMCDRGYYITLDTTGIIYMSWDWSHSGVLKLFHKLERREDGGWNIDDLELSTLYDALAGEKDA